MKPITKSHATQRARERIGIELTRADVTELWAKVEDGRAVFMGHRGGGVKAYAVTLQGKAMTVLLNPKRRVLVTIYQRPGKYPSDRRAG